MAISGVEETPVIPLNTLEAIYCELDMLIERFNFSSLIYRYLLS